MRARERRLIVAFLTTHDAMAFDDYCDEKLGKKLMKAFIFALTNQDEAPDKVICYNTGAFLTTRDADTVKDLKTLEAAGTTVMTCGTCLDFYGLKAELQVGIVPNMYDIVEAQMSAAQIIRP